MLSDNHTDYDLDISGVGAFFRHARAGGHPGALSRTEEQILDSRLRGNDGGLIRKLPDRSDICNLNPAHMIPQFSRNLYSVRLTLI